MDKCDVKVTISAQVGNGQETVVKEMNLIPSDFIRVQVDLAAANLSGKNVTFRFYVRANGTPAQARVIFLNPMIAAKQ
jgi:hypothetical protein